MMKDDGILIIFMFLHLNNDIPGWYLGYDEDVFGGKAKLTKVLYHPNTILSNDSVIFNIHYACHVKCIGLVQPSRCQVNTG
jgi:hypothetical protein